MWVVIGIANNLGPWFTKVNGKVIGHNEEHPLTAKAKVYSTFRYARSSLFCRTSGQSHESYDDQEAIRELVPSPPQRVRIRVPNGKRGSKVSLLVSGNPPNHRTTGNVITLEIPSIELHEVVAVDLAERYQ